MQRPGQVGDQFLNPINRYLKKAQIRRMRLFLDVGRSRTFHENAGIGKTIHNFGGAIIYGLSILSMVDFCIGLILNQIFVSVELAHDMLPE